jgi:hypothetical protein
MILVWMAAAVTLVGRTYADDTEIDFSSDIRPILSDACFHCHGPDEADRDSGIRFDTREGLFGDLGGYAPVVAGDLEASEIVRRIESSEDWEVMPPPESNKTLSDEDKELIKRWIASGADWEQHWAFVPPQSQQPPQSESDDWSRNAIDRFVSERMRRQGLSPNPEASPPQLVRRLFLDLIGMPPTLEEAEQWIARVWPSSRDGAEAGPIDESAYQQLVSHLLASPHYGERWGRRWLDLARYADTNGYEKDRERSIWPYRDWVVDALNADMPFDQFTIEQLAGDMLPDATTEQKIATGFHRNTMLNEEGGIDPLEFRYHAMTDRVATTGTTWLGLTLGCGQCHTHKYDPISHTEYFQMMALLNNADEPQLELPQSGFEERWSRNRQRAEKLLRELPDAWPLPDSEQDDSQATEDEADTATHASEASQDSEEVQQLRHAAMHQAFQEWLEAERQHAGDWRILQPTHVDSSLPILTIQDDASIFASGDTAKRDDYFIDLEPTDRPIHAIELEALPDERLPERGPGTTYYEGTRGDFFLTEIRFSSDDQTHKVAEASASFSKNRFSNSPAEAQLAVDGDIQTGWSVHGRQGERHVAVFVFEKPIPADQQISIHMSFGRHFASSLGRFRFRAVTEQRTEPPQARDYTDRAWRLLSKPAAALTDAQRRELLDVFLMQAPEVAEQAEEIRKLRKRPDVTTTLVLRERPAEHRRPTHRHHRGEYLQAEEQVEPGTPEILPSIPESVEPNRLSFAKWLVSRENPLTARVIVNRQWQTLFGRGIVKTADDFGLQGAPPTHPRLLDFLAVRFMDRFDWSLKELHRYMVSSATYRQSSQVTAEMLERDPENKWLSCMPRFRLEAEILRDSVLVASRQLNPEVGGHPVRPPQPDGVTEVAFGNPKWNASQGADRFRRSLYTFVKRTAPFAMHSTFDAPSGEACIATRDRSNSPLQALTVLNDEMFMELARETGKRWTAVVVAASENVPTEQETLRARLDELFRTALTRAPSDPELDSLTEFWRKQYSRYADSPQAARKLLDVESPEQPSEDSSTEASIDDVPTDRLASWAAWTATSRVLYGLDEFQVRN